MRASTTNSLFPLRHPEKHRHRRDLVKSPPSHLTTSISARQPLAWLAKTEPDVVSLKSSRQSRKFFPWMPFGLSVSRQSGKGNGPGTAWPFSRENTFPCWLAQVAGKFWRSSSSLHWSGCSGSPDSLPSTSPMGILSLDRNSNYKLAWLSASLPTPPTYGERRARGAGGWLQCRATPQDIYRLDRWITTR